MKRERAFNTFTTRDFPYCKRLIYQTSSPSNANTFEYLNSLFTTFYYPTVNFDGIPNIKWTNIGVYLLALNFVNDTSGHYIIL